MQDIGCSGLQACADAQRRVMLPTREAIEVMWDTFVIFCKGDKTEAVQLMTALLDCRAKRYVGGVDKYTAYVNALVDALGAGAVSQGPLSAPVPRFTGACHVTSCTPEALFCPSCRVRR